MENEKKQEVRYRNIQPGSKKVKESKTMQRRPRQCITILLERQRTIIQTNHMKRQDLGHEFHYRETRHSRHLNSKDGTCTSIIHRQSHRFPVRKLQTPISETMRRLGAKESHQDTTSQKGSAHIASISGVSEGRKDGLRHGSARTTGSSRGRSHRGVEGGE